jgi:hypothetical protein
MHHTHSQAAHAASFALTKLKMEKNPAQDTDSLYLCHPVHAYLNAVVLPVAAAVWLFSAAALGGVS